MTRLIALLIICLWAGSALALVDDGINSLGAYFDNAGDVYCYTPTPFVPFQIYWIVAHPIAENLGGYEFAWAYDPDIVPAPIVVNLALPPDGLNIGSNYNLIVSLGSGLITSEATILATFSLITLAPVDPATFITAGPADPSSIPGHAVTIDFSDPSDVNPMTFHMESQEQYVNDQGWVVPGIAQFWSNCEGAAVESAAWSNIKVLFR